MKAGVIAALLILGVCTLSWVSFRIAVGRRPTVVGPWEFDSSEKWEREVARCELCGWTGALENAALVKCDDLVVLYCPRCDEHDDCKLALVSHSAQRPEQTR